MTEKKIVVTPTKLLEQAQRLAAARETIEHDTNLLDTYQGYLGSSKIADRLHHLNTNWSKKRTEILTYLDEMGKGVRTVGEQFQKFDTSYAKAISGGK
ncbi:MAG: WXG100 family type VII secretion target [Mycobacteriales bacterium]